MRRSAAGEGRPDLPDAYTDPETGDTIIAGMGRAAPRGAGQPPPQRVQARLRGRSPEGRVPSDAQEGVPTSKASTAKQTGGRGQFAVARVQCEDPRRDREHLREHRRRRLGAARVHPGGREGPHERMRGGLPARLPVREARTSNSTTASTTRSTRPRWPSRRPVASSSATRSSRSASTSSSPGWQVTITAPESNLGDVLGSLNQRRGQVDRTESGHGDAMRIYGHVPLAEMFKYSEVLRGLSQGRGVYSMEPSSTARCRSRSPMASARRSRTRRRSSFFSSPITGPWDSVLRARVRFGYWMLKICVSAGVRAG